MRHEILSECQIPCRLYAFLLYLGYNSHIIKEFTFLKYTIGYFFRAVQTLLSNYGIFLGSKRNSVSINSQSPFFSPQPLAISNLLSASLDLPILEISYKWNHIICGLLLFTSFQVHLWCSMYQPFVPFCCWIIFHCMDIPQFIHLWVVMDIGVVPIFDNYE